MFAEMGGDKPPVQKGREVKPEAQLSNVVSLPFDLMAFIAATLGEPEVAALMPLSPPEQKALADAVYTHIRNNPALMAMLERGNGGLSTAHLIVVLLTVMQPRIALIQKVIADRKELRELDRLTRPDPAPTVPAASGIGGTPENVPGAVAPGTPGRPDSEPEPNGRNGAEFRAYAVGSA